MQGLPGADLVASPIGRALVVALVADDLSPSGLARFGELNAAEVDAALDHARHVGLLTPTGAIDPMMHIRLVSLLPRAEQAEVHLRVARLLMAEAPADLSVVLTHLRAAGSLADPEAVVDLADNAGRVALSVSDYERARDLLTLAADLDTSTHLAQQGARLCDLAKALDGLGDVNAVRRHAMRALSLGEMLGDGHLVARAALAYGPPVDWYGGDPRTTGLLQRAAAMDLTLDDRVAVMAARAVADMRIPVVMSEREIPVAWVTRAGLAQPLADQAVSAADDCSPEVRCLALVAWRSTHRAPGFLAQRRRRSEQARDLAQQVRNPSLHVEASAWLAVDALEAGDRHRYDEAVATAQWVARRDGNPRLRFRALTSAMGASHLDGDHERAVGLLREARTLAQPLMRASWLMVETLFGAQAVVARDDLDEFLRVRPDPSVEGLVNPLGRAVAAYLWARLGDTDLAVVNARRALAQSDDESSPLLIATRVAAVALEAGDDDLCEQLVTVLSPWADHVAVDANAWWCDGPVALWLAALHHRLGEQGAARSYVDQGLRLARALNDVRSLQRGQELADALSFVPAAMAALQTLSQRELAVLRKLATGATNQVIAEQLAYSVSTIRNDTIAIYRKLGTAGRPEAVARAVSLGLIQAD